MDKDSRAATLDTVIHVIDNTFYDLHSQETQQSTHIHVFLRSQKPLQIYLVILQYGFGFVLCLFVFVFLNRAVEVLTALKKINAR